LYGEHNIATRITGLPKHVFPHIRRDNKFFLGPAEALATAFILIEIESDRVLGVISPSDADRGPRASWIVAQHAMVLSDFYGIK
jgi:hypothetical protein